MSPMKALTAEAVILASWLLDLRAGLPELPVPIRFRSGDSGTAGAVRLRLTLRARWPGEVAGRPRSSGELPSVRRPARRFLTSRAVGDAEPIPAEGPLGTWHASLPGSGQ